MEFDLQRLSSIPLKLKSNRVWRSYQGGKLLEAWQGHSDPRDSVYPEEWVASIVEARNKSYRKDEGLSFIELEDGSTVKLCQLIHQNSELFLGKHHTALYGNHMAVLTKILDAAVRLSIQVHPSKMYARDVFNSAYGKTEAWYVIGGRRVDEEPPYVLLGFKEGITREKWKEYFEKQDVESMVESLHKFYVAPGDVFLIEGSVPHAIGSGCFMIEVQEPTDYTMRVERKVFDGSFLPDHLCHQGVGFEKMLECFHYEGLSREEVIKRWYKEPRIIRHEKGGVEVGLVTAEDTSCFSMNKLSVKKEMQGGVKDKFQTLIVLQGRGQLLYRGGCMNVSQGDMLFLPVNLQEVIYKNSGEKDFELMICLPPNGSSGT